MSSKYEDRAALERNLAIQFLTTRGKAMIKASGLFLVVGLSAPYFFLFLWDNVLTQSDPMGLANALVAISVAVGCTVMGVGFGINALEQLSKAHRLELESIKEAAKGLLRD